MEDKNHDHQHQRAAEEKGNVMDDGEDKRITTSSCSSSGDGVVLLPFDIVQAEVLTRLPVKSLMRFKCVSKLWCSTISHPYFSKALRGRRRQSGLFITYPNDGSLCCMYATLPVGGESALLHERFNLPDSCAKYKYIEIGATQVIDGGLFCVYTDYRAWICNVSTHEVRELPASDLQDAKAFHYYLGFASTSKEYKLLKLCWAPLNVISCNVSWVLEYEILTLGKDASWRRWRTACAPEIDLCKQIVHIIDGGFLCCWHCDRDKLIIFNFQDENFHVINPPRRASSSSSLRGYFLLQLGGHVALAKEKKSYYQGVLNGLVNQRLELWVLELNFHQGESLPPSYEWIYQVINLPLDFPFGGLNFLGNVPTTGEMLLTGVETHNKPTVPVYSYDHRKGKFEKFVIGKFPLSPSPSPSAASIREYKNSFCAPTCEDRNKFCVSYYEEDITPLADLIPFHPQRKKKPWRKKKTKQNKGCRMITLGE